ncbi:MAG: ABC transporter ATP-binding protein [Oscillibacter sp.]|nr:ABC transporter ATP-binding protein [Oscillibacter sp.]
MREPVIEFSGFSFRYKSQNDFTLHDIDLTIYRGEKVLILGPSGSGKSTLGNCINGLIPFSYDGEMKGSCKISGIESREANIFTLSNHVGTVLQDSDTQFVGLSVGEDIAFSLENDAVPRSEMLGKVDAVAKIVGMEDFLGALPYSLSGGQKQKVALAGIMHNNVETLLFDEPLAALDPAMGMSAIALIDEIHKARDKAVIIIEHRLEDVLYRHVDRIILVNDGRIQLDTTPDELLSSDVLKQSGIREPLYLSALKNAGVRFSAGEHLDNIQELDFAKYQDAVVSSFQNVALSAAKPKGETIVEVSHVSFGYNRSRMALDDVSFAIHRGEKISIIGKNGAGKSTAAKLICGIIRPQSGTVKINGSDYSAMSIREIGRMIGYVMQNPNQMLVKDMIKEEIGLALQLNGFDESVIEERTEKVLQMCGLYSMRNWPVGVLSYGQKKRITIASILVLQPDVIILDEPTAGQDYQHYTEIMNFIDALNRDYNIAIVFITHDMHLAIEYTDRAIVFADGKCIADDAVFRVLSNNEIISKANLKQTSLVTLAEKCGIDPEHFIHYFIDSERRERAHG